MKTKVRLLSFLLTIVMLVGLMPMTTLAASEITGVELTITEPTIGANLDFTADVDGASPYTVTGVDWTTRWDAYYVRHNESTIVETGQPYTVYIYLEPKEGYSFAADTDDIAVTINGSSVGITKDLERTRLTCMLTYEELGYTISFDANGGTGTMEDIKVYDDYTLPTCSFGAPEGKAFIGWAIDSAEGTWYYPGTKLEVNTDMRLYAKWTEATGTAHTLTFVNDAFDPPQTETILVNHGTYTLPECLFETAAGCRFGGWWVDTNGDGRDEVLNAGEEIFVTGDMEIYVKWDLIEYRTVRNAEFKATVTGEYKHGMLAGSVSVSLENDDTLPICMVSGGYGHGYWISSDDMLLGSDALSTLGGYKLYVRFKEDDDCSDALICDSSTFKVTGDFGNITPWRNVTVLPDGTYILEFDLPAVPGTELSAENITFTLNGYEADETITAITAGVDTPHVSLRGSGYGSGLDAKSYMIWKDYYDYGYGIYDGPSKFENSRTYYLEINYALDEGYSFPASFWDGDELKKDKFKLSGFEMAEVYEVGENTIVFRLPQMGNTVLENVEFVLNGYEEGEASGNVTVTILDEMIFPRDDLDYFFYDESVGFSPEGAMSPIPATVFENGERYYIAMLIAPEDGYDASELEMEDFTIHTPYGSCIATGYGRATAFTYNEYYYVGFELPVINNAAYTTYTVSFDADGGTGTMSDATGVFGEYTLPANGFTAPSDKQFKAWSVEGVEKAVGEKITVIANTTVTAVWEDISTPKTPVDTVNISDLAKPVVGEMPDNSITVSGTGVTVDDEGSYWGRFDSSRFSPVYDDDTAVDSVVFRDGETYMFQLYLYAEDGYEFTAESKFYFAGELLPAPDMDDLSKSFAMVNPGDSTIAVVYINMNDIAHVHVPGDWDYNDTYHWHKCTASGCDAGTDVSGLPDYAEHSFVDGICTCGAHQHNWSAEWSVNETYHWHECSATGCTATDNSDKDGYAAHDFTTGVCVCGVENVIASIEISGITAPVTGETPINSASVDKVGAEVDEENTFWVRYDTSTGRTSDTYDDGSFVYNTPFREGEIYLLQIMIKPKTGYGFTADTNILYGGTELSAPDAANPTTSCGAIAPDYSMAMALINPNGASAPLTYTVSFDANGGTGTMSDVTGVFGEYTLPANGFTAPAGKQFKAWSVDGNEKAVGDKINVTANTTVKAVWETVSDYTKLGDIAAVTATASIDPVLGAKTNAISFTITDPTDFAAKGVKLSIGSWYKKDASAYNGWAQCTNGVDTFEEGTYRLQVQLRTDKNADNEYYAISGDTTLTVNGVSWSVSDPFKDYYATDGYGWIHFASPEFTLGGKTLDSISVTTPPTKTVYREGEDFNPDGMVVTATYSDSTTAPVLLYTVTDGTDMAAGKTTVTISYTEGGVTKTTTQAITVAKEYTVTVDGGTGNGKYIAGEEVTISAFVSAGQKFKEWQGTESLTFTSGDKNSQVATFTMPAENVNITAVTGPAEYYVSVTDGSGTGMYETGETVTIVANSPEAGKQFKEWFVGDGKVLRFTESDITSSTAKFVMPGEAVRIEATYEDIPHTHVYDKEVATDTYKATEASCMAKATYYKSCACGAKGTETFAYGELAAHTEGTAWSTDATHHWHVCTATGCGAVIEGSKAAHTPDHEGGASEEYAIKCSVCNYEMEPQLSHTHVYDKEVATDTYKATEASCMAKATYYKSCACGAKGTETFAYGELAAHTEGTVWTSDATHHWHVCTATGCGAVIEESKTPHSFEWIIDRDATETQAGAKHEECSVCDYKKETVEIPATGTGTQPESTPTPAPTAPATPLPTAVPVVQSPKTGDSMSWIWLAVFMVSGLGVVTTIVLGKKSQPDKE